MLYFHRIDVTKEIDAYKTSKSKECAVCHCWYCLNKRFKFQPNSTIEPMIYQLCL